MSESNAIVVSSVTKTFGEKLAVSDLDLVVPRGSLYGFIGPNGAGKTTSIRMIMSILFPDSGEISVLGHRSALEAKDRIGYLPEERGVYRKMKVGTFLAYIARLKGVKTPDLKDRIRYWLDRVDLLDVENKKCEELSKGMQQKIQFLSSILHEPELLILDEPFSGLDPINMRLLRELLLEQHERGTTIIFSTHVMHQAEQICDHVVMIDNGKKVLDESLAGIRARFDPRAVLFEPFEPDADIATLDRLPQVASAQKVEGRWEILLADDCEPLEAMRQIVAAVTPARVELHRPTLEDVFVQIVTSGAEASERKRVREALRSDVAIETEEVGQ